MHRRFANHAQRIGIPFKFVEPVETNSRGDPDPSKSTPFLIFTSSILGPKPSPAPASVMLVASREASLYPH